MGNLIKIGRQAYDKVRGLIRLVGRKTNNIDNKKNEMPVEGGYAYCM